MDPTFGELGTRSFGALSLNLSGTTLELASMTISELAGSSIGDLAGSVLGSGGQSSSSSAPLFKPIITTSSYLSNISVVNGQFIVVTDTGRIYVDANDTRIAIGLPNLWGNGNSGKYLQVRSGGTVASVSLPVYNGEFE